jgi:hypothetical protein
VAAQDEIEVLRSWQRGHTLPRRGYGWLAGEGSPSQPPAANRSLLLRADASQYETCADERRYFRLADVAPGLYRLEGGRTGLRGKVDRVVALGKPDEPDRPGHEPLCRTLGFVQSARAVIQSAG